MTALNQDQQDQFWRDGYLVVDNAVDPGTLAGMAADFAGWVEDSRRHDGPYGLTLDGRARFDVEPGHSTTTPGLRRVASPTEISKSCHDAMATSRVADWVAQLIGPNIKFHHSKINSKLPGSGTKVKWHQDFCFEPHTNDDLITALIMVDAVTAHNGPLEVAAGSHTGPLHGLWHKGVFTGAVADEVARACQADALTCTGSAGSVCLMHTRLLHGSAANRSTMPRTLFICVYAAEDAIACCPNPLPSRHEGMIVRGRRTNIVRAVPYQMELPQKPASASFFNQQEQHEAANG